MDKKQTTDKRLSWFWRWFLNNQVVTSNSLTDCLIGAVNYSNFYESFLFI